MSTTTPRRSGRQPKTTSADPWPRARPLKQAGLQALSVVLSVAIGYAVLLTPAVASQLRAGSGQAPAVVTVTSQGPPLDPADIDALSHALPNATISRNLAPVVIPTIATSRNLAPEVIPTTGTSSPTSIEAVDSAFFGVYGLTLVSGTIFTSADDLRANPVAVIGQQTAETVFGSATQAIGQPLRARNVSLTVIGVVAQPADADVSGFGQRVFVPLQTGRIRLVGVRAPIELAIGADDAADASDLAVSASNVLRQRYPLAASTFSVRTYVGSGGPESILRALPQAAAGVRAEFLQTKHLVSQPAAPTHAARLQSATGLTITTT